MKPGNGSLSTQNPQAPGTGIYVREGATHIGPFATLVDARRFIELIGIFGEDTDGIEVVEVKEGAPAADRQFCCH